MPVDNEKSVRGVLHHNGIKLLERRTDEAEQPDNVARYFLYNIQVRIPIREDVAATNQLLGVVLRCTGNDLVSLGLQQARKHETRT